MISCSVLCEDLVFSYLLLALSICRSVLTGLWPGEGFGVSSVMSFCVFSSMRFSELLFLLKDPVGTSLFVRVSAILSLNGEVAFICTGLCTTCRLYLRELPYSVSDVTSPS